MNRRSLANQNAAPSSPDPGALSLARVALTRSLLPALHLPAYLALRATHTCHSHLPAPSMCPSSPRASQMPALAELIVCTALATRSSLHSSCVWQAASSSDDEISMVFARTSARSSQHDMEAPREDGEKKKKQRAFPFFARPFCMLPCVCPPSQLCRRPHRRMRS